MSAEFLDECLPVLSSTPAALAALLRDAPECWTAATDGPGTWSPYDVIGHLIHGEKADWIPRLTMILEQGESRAFDPFDREAQFRDSAAAQTAMSRHGARNPALAGSGFRGTAWLIAPFETGGSESIKSG